MLARNRSRRRSGLSLIELLVLLAILGVLLGLAAIQGRAIAQRASERSVVNTFQQAVWQGATLAAARGFRTETERPVVTAIVGVAACRSQDARTRADRVGGGMTPRAWSRELSPQGAGQGGRPS